MRRHTEDGHLATRVTVHRLPDVSADDTKRERVYESLRESFWEEAQLVAHRNGFSGVFSEGRSGGWCVPYYQFQNGKVQQFTGWPGQGGTHGYPHYPLPEDAEELAEFEAFDTEVKELLQAYIEEYVRQCNANDEEAA